MPSPEHVRALDEFFGARGELVALATAARGGAAEPPPVVSSLRLADVFSDVADALVEKLVREGTALGWRHNLADTRDDVPPTPLSTAYVIRALQLLDDARVNLHALGEALVAKRVAGGWTNRLGLEARPEVTAMVLAALARLGLLTDLDEALTALRRGIDDFARSRPYVLTVVLESLLAIRPDAPMVDELVGTLLDARKVCEGRLLWTADASAPSGLVEASLVHTARAVTVLHAVRHAGSDVDDAVTSAVEWIIDRPGEDHGTTERLEPDPRNKGADVTIDHFTAAWCVRALVAADGVPAVRLDRALRVLWSCYDAEGSHLFVWRNDGKLPSWMTHDAVSALHTMAMASISTPLPAHISRRTDVDRNPVGDIDAPIPISRHRRSRP